MSQSDLSRQILNLTGAAKKAHDIFVAQLDFMRALNLPPGFLSDLEAEFTVDFFESVAVNTLNNVFDETEASEIIRFFNSSAGQKYVKSPEAVSQDVSSANRELLRKIFTKHGMPFMEEQDYN